MNRRTFLFSSGALLALPRFSPAQEAGAKARAFNLKITGLKPNDIELRDEEHKKHKPIEVFSLCFLCS